ncbi:hypothetical protein L3X38_018873 [Prunus dulcis]|uniref:Uncharacterized protein n=1 Tax=Prunus dulcis TaxID=3755 RepID=A0AAD4WCF1_PRUDU|nr:hypothetical protein L3X38_018873 [Prunus dulcis]
MDKSWIDIRDRTSTQYLTRHETFWELTDFRFHGNSEVKRVWARAIPGWVTHWEVAYTDVTFDSIVGDDMIGMLHDAFGHPNAYSILVNDRPIENEHDEGLNGEGPNGRGRMVRDQMLRGEMMKLEDS